MSFKGIKRNKTDALFSDIVRMKAGWKCEYCFRSFEQEKHLLDCSHYISRGNRRTRWDFSNVSAICRGDHMTFGRNPWLHTEFMKKKLGEKGLNDLIIRSQRRWDDQKIDEKFIRYGLQVEMDKLKFDAKQKILGAR